MPGWRGTLAQRVSVGLGVFYAVFGAIGLAINPDFGTGADLSSELFVVDWNGWHAVDTLLFAAIAFIAAARPRWALIFLEANAIANAGVAVWALFDSTPLGVLDLPHVTTDVILHLVVAAVSLVAFLAQRATNRKNRRTAPA